MAGGGIVTQVHALCSHSGFLHRGSYKKKEMYKMDKPSIISKWYYIYINRLSKFKKKILLIHVYKPLF